MIDVVARIVDGAGNAGGEFAIDDDAFEAADASIAALTNGSFVVAYVDRDGASTPHVAFKIVSSTGAVGGIKNLPADAVG
jgi:hypothetical protein